MTIRLSRKHGSHCRGFSLVEMVAVVGLTALLLGLVVTLLASLLNHQSAIHQSALQRSEINRLTDILRRDLQQAASIPLIENKTLSIELPNDETIRYTLDGELCHRERNAFQIGPIDSWQIDSTEPVITVTLQRRPVAETDLPAIPIRIVAIQ